MPRNGAGVASAVPGFGSYTASTTILSALMNAGLVDVINMLNSPWPLSVGLGAAGQIGSWDAITAKGTDIPSASTIVLTTATGPRIDITGVTTITAVTLANGSSRIARATGAFQFTASATLLVNGSASTNYTTTAGDLLFFEAEGGIVSVYVINRQQNVFDPLKANGPYNFSFDAVGAANALTFTLKTAAGATPSATDAVILPFRGGLGSTPHVARSVTAATTLVLSPGSTLGIPASTACRVWFAAFDDAGTVRLAAICCTTISSGVVTQYPLGASGFAATTTAEGGAGAADSAQTFYTTVATGGTRAYLVLGYVEYTSGLGTPGNWTTPGVLYKVDETTRYPGDVLQVARTETGAVNTGSTLIPYDDTIPQITEGNEYMTCPITPGRSPNILRITCGGYYGTSVASNVMVSCLFQDANTDALAVGMNYALTAGGPYYVGFQHAQVAGSVSATTFRNRAGGVSAGTLTFNGASAARKFGGTLASFLQVEEIMA
jgi:hypothetical protein